MIVGTAGHIDHGKTALVRALTGVDTDRLGEEKRRGITIELGFAYRDLGAGLRVGFVDVPGHERLVHTMLAGAGGIDAALLVVAADDGVMAQTREHLAILDLLGVGEGVVALTKRDLAEPARLAAVETGVRSALAGTGLAAAPILPVSTLTGQGVAALRDRLAGLAGRIGARAAGGRFRLSVDRSFVIAGTGTVVTGTVLSGTVRVGDTVTVSPSGLSARVRSIHALDQPAEIGVAGQRCALNLAGEAIERGAIGRGDMILDPELHAPTDRIDARLRLLPGDGKPVGAWFPVRLHHGAAEVGARVVPLRDAPIAPGEQAIVQLVLDVPIAAGALDRFVVRDTSARRTLGGGRFVDLAAPARRRRTPERLAQLAAMAMDEPGTAIEALLAVPPFHLGLADFARQRALRGEEVEALVDRLHLVRLGSDVVMAPAGWRRLDDGIHGALAEFHASDPDLPGLGLERLRLSLDIRLSAPVFRRALAKLQEDGAIGLDGSWVRLSGHKARFGPADEALWARTMPQLSGVDRFRPPRTRDLAAALGVPEAEMRRVLKTAGRMGLVHEVALDHFFLRAVVAEIVGIVVDIARTAPEGLTAADLRDRLENGRKVAIQILEFLDRHGTTIRKGDLRRPNPHRLDLFGVPAANGREASPVGRPDFKSGRGREPASGGFDSHSPPPMPQRSP